MESFIGYGILFGIFFVLYIIIWVQSEEWWVPLVVYGLTAIVTALIILAILLIDGKIKF